jgi:hypothetical protein
MRHSPFTVYPWAGDYPHPAKSRALSLSRAVPVRVTCLIPVKVTCFGCLRSLVDPNKLAATCRRSIIALRTWARCKRSAVVLIRLLREDLDVVAYGAVKAASDRW